MDLASYLQRVKLRPQNRNALKTMSQQEKTAQRFIMGSPDTWLKLDDAWLHGVWLFSHPPSSPSIQQHRHDQHKTQKQQDRIIDPSRTISIKTLNVAVPAKRAVGGTTLTFPNVDVSAPEIWDSGSDSIDGHTLITPFPNPFPSRCSLVLLPKSM